MDRPSLFAEVSKQNKEKLTVEVVIANWSRCERPRICNQFKPLSHNQKCIVMQYNVERELKRIQHWTLGRIISCTNIFYSCACFPNKTIAYHYLNVKLIYLLNGLHLNQLLKLNCLLFLTVFLFKRQVKKYAKINLRKHLSTSKCEIKQKNKQIQESITWLQLKR